MICDDIMKKLCLILILMLFLFRVNAQKLSLQACIDSAINNNIQLKIQKLDQENASINLKKAQMSYLPTASAQVGQSFDFGQSPTSNNLIVNNNSTSTGFGASVSIPLFTGFKIYHQVQIEKINLKAVIEDFSKAKEDLSLNVAAQYLQILLYKQLAASAEEQVATSISIVSKTQKSVEAGIMSISDLYEAQSSLARDELMLFQNQQNVQLALLDLSQLLELKNITGFDIETPETGTDCINNLTSSVNDFSESEILSLRPAIRSQQLRILSSEQELKSVKTGYLPTLGFSYSYSNGYYYLFSNSEFAGNLSFAQQMRQNSRNGFYFSLNIPIFSRFDVRNQVKLAQLNILRHRMKLENDQKAILKDIHQAQFNSEAAKAKYAVAQKSMEAAKIAYQFTQEKYDNGRSTVFELNDSKARKVQSEAEMLQARFEYVFKSMILQFYLGGSVRL